MLGNLNIFADIEPLNSSPVVTYWQPKNKKSSYNSERYDVLKPEKNTPSGCKCYIIPPHIQEKLKQNRLDDQDLNIRNKAHIQGEKDLAFRKFRNIIVSLEHAFTLHTPHPFGFHTKQTVPSHGDFDPNPFVQSLVRTVFDAKTQENLPGDAVISSKGASGYGVNKTKGSTNDQSALTALDNALNVFLFYLKQYRHNSIDGKGMPITSSIHFGDHYENAFWNGTEMVYGDGSDMFKPFVNYLDVVGHELTHGVTGSRLDYNEQSGALNEHFSDVMGYLVYMYTHQLTTAEAPWLLADGILTIGKKSYPLRSFKAPGTAYDTPELGKDPQPAKYGDLYKGTDDNGGVHINSGIPNHAFYLFANALGGNAWEIAGLIWFTTMMTKGAFKPTATMEDFANATIKTADTLFGENQKVTDSIRQAWKETEVLL